MQIAQHRLTGNLSLPVLDSIVPQGFRFGGNYLVEFDPHVPWYETSLTIVLKSVGAGIKTEYHTFYHRAEDIKNALEGLGLDVGEETNRGRLRIIDSYTATTSVRKRAPKVGQAFLSERVPSLKDWGKVLKRQIAKGIPASEKRWLHIDDNTTLLLQYNSEEEFFNGWRTVFVPWGRARELITLNGFVSGVASDVFYKKFEALYDGIFDLSAREEGGRLSYYIRPRVFHEGAFNSAWARLTLLSNGQVVVRRESNRQKERRLAAIMFTDLVGYSKLMGRDEGLAIRLLGEQDRIIRSIVPKRGGRIVKTAGDSYLVEFASATEATECALRIQRRMGSSRKMRMRIGIHIGDVIRKEGDIFGDSVNIASRLQSLAKPGRVCVSKQVLEQLRNKARYPAILLGSRRLKNIKEPVEVYEVALAPKRSSARVSASRHEPQK